MLSNFANLSIYVLNNTIHGTVLFNIINQYINQYMLHKIYYIDPKNICQFDLLIDYS